MERDKLINLIGTFVALGLTVFYVIGFHRLRHFIQSGKYKKHVRSLLLGVVMFGIYPFLKKDPRADAIHLSIYVMLIFEGLMGALLITPIVDSLLEKKD